MQPDSPNSLRKALPLRTLKIVTAPDPGLQAICEPCDPSDKSLKKLAQRMAATMYKNNGCGLAAPQVGILKRLVVIDCGDPEDDPDPIYLINPEVIACLLYTSDAADE